MLKHAQLKSEFFSRILQGNRPVFFLPFLEPRYHLQGNMSQEKFFDFSSAAADAVDGTQGIPSIATFTHRSPNDITDMQGRFEENNKIISSIYQKHEEKKGWKTEQSIQ